MLFPFEEYEDRWRRVYLAAGARGCDAIVIWQRSGGSYDRLGNVLWLCNYASLSSGQERVRPNRYGGGFAAMIFSAGEVPELHIVEPLEATDLDALATPRVYSHSNLIDGVAGSLAKLGIEGPVLYVGDDTLPARFARRLSRRTPGIDWRAADDLLDDVMRIKSPRELDCYREAGEVSTRALTAMMKALIAGQPESEAAAKAAAECVRAGGGFHRIGIHHGPKSEHVIWSSGLYGFSTSSPEPGDIVRAWVYGPILHGYWLDPGRTAVAGNSPSSKQRKLIEGCGSVVSGLLGAIKPGVKVRDVGLIGDKLMDDAGGNQYPQTGSIWASYGHGVGTFFGPPFIPASGRYIAPEAVSADEKYDAGMTVGVEAFLTFPGVGTAGIEQNAIVVSEGVELLTRTPVLFW